MFFACFWCPGGTSRHRWDGPRAIGLPLSATGAPRVLNSSKNRFCEFSKIELSPTWEHVFGLSRSVPRGRCFFAFSCFQPKHPSKVAALVFLCFFLDFLKLSSRLHESSFSASQSRSREVDLFFKKIRIRNFTCMPGLFCRCSGFWKKNKKNRNF